MLQGILSHPLVEAEITTVNQEFLKDGELKYDRRVRLVGYGTRQLDEATNYIETIEKRQGLKVAAWKV